jgi:hypothetical protein
MVNRETKLIASILSDEANAERSAEEVADLCIVALDDYRAGLRRYMPVIQVIRPSDGPGEPYLIGPPTTYSQALTRASVGVQVHQVLGRQGLTIRAMVGTVIGSTRELLSDYEEERPESTGSKLIKWIEERRQERIGQIRQLITEGLEDEEIAKKMSCSPVWIRRIKNAKN